MLDGAPGSSLSEPGERLEIPAAGTRWVADALLLARGAESIDERELRTAPELFAIAIESGNGNGYPFLERHHEGGGRSVLARVR